MDINSIERYPSSALSNFAPNRFVFREVPAASMEGFLQGLKFEDPKEQRRVMTLVGRLAKSAGENQNWQQNGLLYFQGDPIKRLEKEYQQFLDEAYWVLFSQNDETRIALLATGDEILTHVIGKRRRKDTVLTRTEFTSRLLLIRDVFSGNGSNRFNRFVS